MIFPAEEKRFIIFGIFIPGRKVDRNPGSLFGGGNLVIQNNTCGYDPKKATGISVYFPARDKYSEDYESLLLSREYHWKDFLTTYLQKILAI